MDEASSDDFVPTATNTENSLSRTYVKEQLECCLSGVQYAGSFMSYKTSQSNVDPGLYVNNVGNIRLPLDGKAAQAIMKVTRQAPFGRGSQTVVDTSFRNTK